MNIKLPLLVFSLIIFTSCRTTNEITYFQGLDEQLSLLSAQEAATYDTRIAPDDLLSITVSSIEPTSVAIFNLPLVTYVDPSEMNSVKTAPVIQSYLVDSKGCIDFPVLGKVHVAGMTRDEVTGFLKDQISQYAKSPLVTVRIQNFKITVLGEVVRPGTKGVANERVSILDAIGLAGDLTIYGERKNVLLYREVEGKKFFHRFDLTSPEIFTSPYFYLQQNDVVYVEPNDARKKNATYSQRSQFNISVMSTIVSALSLMVSLGIALFK